MAQQQQTKRRADWVCKTLQEVADFFDVERSTVHDWHRKGMPGQKGNWYLPEIIVWYATLGPNRTEAARSLYLREYLNRNRESTNE